MIDEKFYITDTKYDVNVVNEYLFILDTMLNDMSNVTLNDIHEWFEDLQKKLGV